MKVLLSISLSLFALMAFNSCKKVEGPGGAATIKGHILKEKMIAGQAYFHDAADEDVYLIYGNEDSFYDDDIKTSYDGTFEFNYLEEGNYQFFVYSDCPTCLSGDTIIKRDIVISEKKEVFDLGTITIE
ncbi:MAG: hypothetical protein ACPGVI_03060 [Crocinitomicaceae bacterium]